MDQAEGVITLRIDRERERLIQELVDVNERLAAARLQRSDLEGRIGAFATLHDRMVAPLYADLDEVRADLAELLADRSGLPSDREDAIRARKRAERSRRAAEGWDKDGGGTPGSGFDAVAKARPQPSEEARSLFRMLIKQCHPDLAATELERIRREEFTRAVNEAYADGDIERLEDLAQQWTLHRGEGRISDHASRDDLQVSVASARRDLEAVIEELAALRASGLGRILVGATDPAAAVRAVASHITAEIGRQRQTLSRLRGEA